MTKDTALRLALEALVMLLDNYVPEATEEDISQVETTITAIKAALEAKDEPEQMAKLGWQVIDCPICGGGARAFPKQEVKDEPVAHSVVAGALFDFMGWLTSREKRLILSSVDEASPAVEAITEFAIKRNLSLKYAEVGYWTEFLATPPQQEAKDEPVAFKIYKPTPPRGAIPNVRDAELPWVYDQDPSSGNVASMWVTPVKATPPQRKPLTDEEIGAILEGVNAYGTRLYTFARAIEAAHGIKGEA